MALEKFLRILVRHALEKYPNDTDRALQYAEQYLDERPDIREALFTAALEEDIARQMGKTPDPAERQMREVLDQVYDQQMVDWLTDRLEKDKKDPGID